MALSVPTPRPVATGLVQPTYAGLVPPQVFPGDRAGQSGPVDAIRVVAVDDHITLLEALAMRLRVEPGVTVVAACSEPDEAVGAATRADIALLDLSLGDHDGVDLGARMRRRNPRIGLVAATCVEDAGRAVDAVRVGFRGWVPKDDGIDRLVEAVRIVHDGGTSFPPRLLTDVLARLLAGDQAESVEAGLVGSLTQRETEVLRLMAQGGDREVIAHELFLSAHTVRTHQQSILRKLGVHSALAAVAVARRSGLA